MCTKTKTTFGCGHCVKTTEECGDPNCQNVEKWKFPKMMDCGKCKAAGNALTRERAGRRNRVREQSRHREPGQSSADATNPTTESPGTAYMAISPWIQKSPGLPQQEQWTTPTRQKADEAWLVEHERRMLELDERTKQMSPRSNPQDSRGSTARASHERVLKVTELMNSEESVTTIKLKPTATQNSVQTVSRRTLWSKEEDDVLIGLVNCHGTDDWIRISELMPHRTTMQCRDRYNRYLNPNLSHGPISEVEEDKIRQLVAEVGPKWAVIARRLGNRSDLVLRDWWKNSSNQSPGLSTSDTWAPRIEGSMDDPQPHADHSDESRLRVSKLEVAPKYAEFKVAETPQAAIPANIAAIDKTSMSSSKSDAIQRISCAPEHTGTATHDTRQECEHKLHRAMRGLSIAVTQSSNLELASTMLPVPTDSGYASARPEIDAHKPERQSMEEIRSASDDERTVYSDNDSVGTTQRECLRDTFVEHLTKSINMPILDNAQMALLHDEMPGLLEDFATRLRSNDTSPEARKAMVFIYKHRKAISQHFVRLIGPHMDESNEEPRSAQAGMPLEDKIRFWLDRIQNQTQTVQVQDIPMEEALVDLSPNLEDFELLYARTVLNSDAYGWLVNSLRRKLLLTSSEENAANRIRETLLRTIPALKELRGDTEPTMHNVIVYTRWSPKVFARSQLQDVKSPLSHFLTLTGHGLDVQALTCKEYMEQTWPQTGLQLLQLIEDLCSEEFSEYQRMKRLDGLIIEAFLLGDGPQNSYLRVHIFGCRGQIAEVAQQLAWLSAALQTSPNPEELRCCTPSIKHCGPMNVTTNQAEQYAASIATESDYLDTRPMSSTTLEPMEPSTTDGNTHFFEIQYDFAALLKTDVRCNSGQCWQNMLHGGVIVQHFPIQKRPHDGLGLEIALATVAKLVGTRYINQFEESVFIRGYSTSLLPTEIIGQDILLWHFCENETGSYLSYNDLIARAISIGVNDLASYRHIVGWTKTADILVGSADADYNVGRSKLEAVGPSRSHSLLGGQKLLFPRRFPDENTVVLTRDQQPISPDPEDYHTILRRLRTCFFLLWDDSDKRGWLVNGVAALLHLIRGSLKADEEEWEGTDVFCCQLSSLVEAQDPYRAASAGCFLSNEANLRTRLCMNQIGGNGEASYELLGDRMVRFYHLLNIAIDYQQRDTLQGPLPRSRLEGWDFRRLTTQKDQISACYTTLPEAGRSWVDLTRAIGTVTLFGRGFGELIRPSRTTQMCCRSWSLLPRERYYIAVSIPDIIKVMNEEGDSREEPRELTSSLVWHNQVTAFGSCGCTTGGLHAPNSLLVQTAWPKLMYESANLSSQPIDLKDSRSGAIVFGYNEALRWHFRDHGPPAPGEASTEISVRQYLLDHSDTENHSHTGLSRNDDRQIFFGETISRSESSPDQALSHKVFGSSINTGGQHHFGDSFGPLQTNYFNITNCSFQSPSMSSLTPQSGCTPHESMDGSFSSTSNTSANVGGWAETSKALRTVPSVTSDLQSTSAVSKTSLFQEHHCVMKDDVQSSIERPNTREFAGSKRRRSKE